MTEERPKHLRVVGGMLQGAAAPPIENGGGGADEGVDVTMPEGCPVEPLGTADNLFWFLTALGELRGLAADKVANKHIVAMFAPRTEYLFEHWPRRKEVPVRDERGKLVKDKAGNAMTEWITTGWRADDLSMLLMKACAGKGVWSAQEKVRGRGAWVDEDDNLVLHSGNGVLINGVWQRPGRFGELVYPTAPPIPRPCPEPVDNRLPSELLGHLRSWNWIRPEVDPLLMLGWIVSGMMGGALDHRPVVWVTGDKATGKTSLQRLIIGVMDGGLLQSSNATEAAVRQLLGQQSLPVSIDEAEADEDNRKMLQVVGLARVAASGGRIHRGGQDHQGVEFTARSCFLFSSILVPPLTAADRSRLAVCELGRLPPGSREPKITAQEMRDIGAALRRRAADGWPQWAVVLDLFRTVLIDHGKHGGRSADVFGTLLTAAHVVLHDELPDDEKLMQWARDLHADTLAEMADDVSEADRCMAWLGSSLVQLAGHGTPRLVSDWVRQACDESGPEQQSAARTARDMLGKVGIGIFTGAKRKGEREGGPSPGRQYLMIASAHQGLAGQFEGSHWKGKSGANGVWVQALARIEGAVRGEKQRIGGVSQRCTLVPIEAIFGDPSPTDEEAAAAAAEAADA
jgi:hypothetical protein